MRTVPPAVFPALQLTLTSHDASVEEAVRLHLHSETAPAFYVENALITSLFGLLFWEAIFAPVRGAFFHRFHAGPVDLYDPQFAQRRRAYIERCFASLDSEEYVATLRKHYKEKHGTVSPFVAWEVLTEQLIDLALQCMPPAHLKLFFQRILENIRDNCTGLPDLVKFWPEQSRYELIEVKGPGDRLQDHQQRWVLFCSMHEIPLRVAYVSWAEAQA